MQEKRNPAPPRPHAAQDDKGLASERLDDEWFANGERISSAPPSSRRAPKPAESAPAEPIGDAMVDVWFR